MLPGTPSFRVTSFHPVPLHHGQSSLAIFPFEPRIRADSLMGPSYCPLHGATMTPAAEICAQKKQRRDSQSLALLSFSILRLSGIGFFSSDTVAKKKPGFRP